VVKAASTAVGRGWSDEHPMVALVLSEGNGWAGGAGVIIGRSSRV
jgi:hypothetical protein